VAAGSGRCRAGERGGCSCGSRRREPAGRVARSCSIRRSTGPVASVRSFQERSLPTREGASNCDRSLDQPRGVFVTVALVIVTSCWGRSAAPVATLPIALTTARLSSSAVRPKAVYWPSR
jgi:hypothetical protein